ncbi:unnamed protein product [Amoebophrya sp. A25]|nr:unnamed protein product [Amoebophrya sp. A25]|eukprot:GSA25T00018810001.1
MSSPIRNGNRKEQQEDDAVPANASINRRPSRISRNSGEFNVQNVMLSNAGIPVPGSTEDEPPADVAAGAASKEAAGGPAPRRSNVTSEVTGGSADGGDSARNTYAAVARPTTGAAGAPVRKSAVADGAQVGVAATGAAKSTRVASNENEVTGERKSKILTSQGIPLYAMNRASSPLGAAGGNRSTCAGGGDIRERTKSGNHFTMNGMLHSFVQAYAEEEATNAQADPDSLLSLYQLGGGATTGSTSAKAAMKAITSSGSGKLATALMGEKAGAQGAEGSGTAIAPLGSGEDRAGAAGAPQAQEDPEDQLNAEIAAAQADADRFTGKRSYRDDENYTDKWGMTDLERKAVGLPSRQEARYQTQKAREMRKTLHALDAIMAKMRWDVLRKNAKVDGGGEEKLAEHMDVVALMDKLEDLTKNLNGRPEWEKRFHLRNEVFMQAKKLKMEHNKAWGSKFILHTMSAKPALDKRGLAQWLRSEDEALEWPSRGHYLYARACQLLNDRLSREEKRAKEILDKDAADCPFKPEHNPRKVDKYYQNWSDVGKTTTRGWRVTPSFEPHARTHVHTGPTDVYDGFLKICNDAIDWEEDPKTGKVRLKKQANLKGLLERHKQLTQRVPTAETEHDTALKLDKQGVYAMLIRDNIKHQESVEQARYAVECVQPDPLTGRRVVPQLDHPVVKLLQYLDKTAAKEADKEKRLKRLEEERLAAETAAKEQEEGPRGQRVAGATRGSASRDGSPSRSHHVTRKGLDTGLPTNVQTALRKRHEERRSQMLKKLEVKEEKSWRVAVHRMQKMDKPPRSLVDLKKAEKPGADMAEIEGALSVAATRENKESNRAAARAGNKGRGGGAASGGESSSPDPMSTAGGTTSGTESSFKAGMQRPPPRDVDRTSAALPMTKKSMMTGAMTASTQQLTAEHFAEKARATQLQTARQSLLRGASPGRSGKKTKKSVIASPRSSVSQALTSRQTRALREKQSTPWERQLHAELIHEKVIPASPRPSMSRIQRGGSPAPSETGNQSLRNPSSATIRGMDDGDLEDEMMNKALQETKLRRVLGAAYDKMTPEELERVRATLPKKSGLLNDPAAYQAAKRQSQEIHAENEAQKSVALHNQFKGLFDASRTDNNAVTDTLAEALNIVGDGLGVSSEHVAQALKSGVENQGLNKDEHFSKAMGAVSRANEHPDLQPRRSSRAGSPEP